MIFTSRAHAYDKNIDYNNISVQNVSFINVEKNWNYARRFSHAYELVFVTKGSLNFMINKVSYTLSESEYIIIPPFCTLSGSALENRSSFYAIVFSSNFELISQKISKVYKAFGNTTFLQNVLKIMLSTYTPSVRTNNYLDSLLLIAIYELENLSKTPIKAEFPLQEILDYIHKNVNKPITMKDLSDEFSYSADYISRIFKAHYGVSTKTYINQIKLSSAKRLLTTSNLSLTKVGENIGFDDVKLFYKFFKYYEKMTPFEYRKKYTQL